MNDAVIHIDNYMIGHADSWSEAIQSRGMLSVALGRQADVPSLTKVDYKIGLPRLDRPAIEQALAEFEVHHKIRGIRCMFGMAEHGETLASIIADQRAKRGLPGPSAQALDVCNVKSLTRVALDKADIPNIAYLLASNAEQAADFYEELGKPVILKPITGVASGFVRRCNSRAEIFETFAEMLQFIPHAYHRPTRSSAFDARSPWGRIFVDTSNSVLVEEYIDGPELSVECLVLVNEIEALVVHDKVTLCEDRWTVREPLLLTPPRRLSKEKIASVEAYATKCVRATGLTHTLCHVEIRIDPIRGPLLIEINPRIGAGCVRDSLETFWGLDPVTTDIDIALGIPPPMSRFERKNDAHVMIFVFTERCGMLKRIDGMDQVLRQPGVLCVRQMTQIGSYVDGEKEEQFVVGVWRRLVDGQTAEDAFEATMGPIHIEIEE